MRKSLSIGFALVLLAEAVTPAMDAADLAKLPALVEHYKTHKSENRSISLLTFLNLHFLNSQHHNQDHQNHHNLPFASHEHNCSIHQLLYTIPELTFEFHAQHYTEQSKDTYRAPAPLTSSATIWQPPRL